MDLTEWLLNWGPAVPLFLFFIRSQNRLVDKIVADGFQKIVEEQHAIDRRARKRHGELIDRLEEIRPVRKATQRMKGKAGKK